MLIDMNGDGTLAAETLTYSDFPYVAPARTLPVREEVIIRGSRTGGVTTSVTGNADEYEPGQK